MKLLGRGLGSAILLSVMVAAAQHPAAARSNCKKISGTLVSSVTATGCTGLLCTAGEFKGDGLLNGTTSFTADSLLPAASTEPPTTLAYSGLLTITTDKGTLTTRDTGIFDTAAGLFSSRDVVVSGTGIFEGATGHLFFHGTGTTTFDSEASGVICLAK